MVKIYSELLEKAVLEHFSYSVYDSFLTKDKMEDNNNKHKENKVVK